MYCVNRYRWKKAGFGKRVNKSMQFVNIFFLFGTGKIGFNYSFSDGIWTQITTFCHLIYLNLVDKRVENYIGVGIHFGNIFFFVLSAHQ